MGRVHIFLIDDKKFQAHFTSDSTNPSKNKTMSLNIKTYPLVKSMDSIINDVSIRNFHKYFLAILYPMNIHGILNLSIIGFSL